MMLWLVQAWFVGVMLLSVRTAGGLLWLARTRRGEIEPLSEEMYRQCLLLQERMGLRRHIRYGESRELDSPVVLGWFRPIVLVTTQAITGLSPQQLQAIIAHELAHIRRYDAFVNLFQIVAEMVLFYHPAVWWVSRRVRVEREVCCDHEALAACGEPVSYARALTMMEEWRAAPSMLMAANRSPLAERVLRLLGMQGTSARSRAAGLGACVIGVAAALFAGTVFVAAAKAQMISRRHRSVSRQCPSLLQLRLPLLRLGRHPVRKQ
jgi:beta-lactamase regulating signal transducer with metallopeptidase domain